MNSMNLHERITQPLYDTARFRGNSITGLFDTPVGQGTTCFGTGAKHFGDTNMYNAGQLPAGQKFIIESIVAEPLDRAWDGPGLAGATLDLRLGTKTYLNIPVTRARATVTLRPGDVDAAMHVIEALRTVHPSALTMLLGSMPGVAVGFDLAGNTLTIVAGEHFMVELHVPDTFKGSGVVRIYLNGHLARMVQ